MKILVTGFKPFLGESLNPSEHLAVELQKSFPYVQSLILPVEFLQSFKLLEECLDRSHYDYVILMGQAAGRGAVCLEKLALNWAQSELADEAGVIPETGPISSQSELALMSKFPVDEIYKKLKIKSYPVELSFSAGTYVCNDLYFRVCEKYKDLKVVFVHVPLIKEQVTEAQPRSYIELTQQKEILKSLVQELSELS